jgi:hypothetical protein
MIKAAAAIVDQPANTRSVRCAFAAWVSAPAPITGSALPQKQQMKKT